MPRANYRVSALTIEGFRGFTRSQSFSLDENNLFVFGQNGRGKSSIVEAIRWCLFGSASGSDIEVRNTFYPTEECRVEILLTGSEGGLRIQRELRPGAERSRQTIRTLEGGEVLARNVLPQLTRLGAHESTQVIFAAQHAAGRQFSADISEFGKVLCFYLQLEDVPDLIRGLDTLRQEKLADAEQLAKRIESVEQRYRERLKEFNTRIQELSRNPPWGSELLPVSWTPR